MDNTEQVYEWQNIFSLVPVVAVALYGLVVAVYRWHRHPRVSLVVAIALGVLLAADLGVHLLIILAQRGLPIGSVPMLILVVGLMSSLGNAAAIGLLLWAAFGWRGAPAKRLRPDDDPLS
jgi:hypothetical protein